MWCYSEATCTARNQSTPWEMSNSKLAPNLAVGGIFSTSHKNPWAAANVAYVPYCSSDAWCVLQAASTQPPLTHSHLRTPAGWVTRLQASGLGATRFGGSASWQA